MTEYNLKITKIESLPSKNKSKTVVKKVHWLYEGTDEKYYASMEGVVDLDEPSSDNFTKYDDLTEEIVKNWVFEKMDENHLKDYINKNIETQKMKTVISNVPWMKN